MGERARAWGEYDANRLPAAAKAPDTGHNYNGPPVVHLMGYAGSYPRPYEYKPLRLLPGGADPSPVNRTPHATGIHHKRCAICDARFRTDDPGQAACSVGCGGILVARRREAKKRELVEEAETLKIRRTGSRHDREPTDPASHTRQSRKNTNKATGETRVCVVCGVTFNVFHGAPNQRSCSRKCGSVVRVQTARVTRAEREAKWDRMFKRVSVPVADADRSAEAFNEAMGEAAPSTEDLAALADDFMPETT